MPRLKPSLVLPLTVVLSLAALAPPAAAISFGEVDYDNAYPNVGCIVATPQDGSAPFVCFSGVLIHPRVFLSCGHGLIYLHEHPEWIPLNYVSFGPYALDPSTWHEIEAVAIHPDYQTNWGWPYLNDVAVAILKEPVEGVPLAKLPYAGYLDDLKRAGLLQPEPAGGALLTVVGYGCTMSLSPPVAIPADGWRRFADTSYLALEQKYLVSKRGTAAEYGGVGTGDSGGPEFWTEPDGTLVVMGTCTTSDPHRVAWNRYWRTDIPETLDFIYGVLRSLP